MTISRGSLAVAIWVADNVVLTDLGQLQPVTLADAKAAYNRLTACYY